ncbi:TPA: tyrosine-type recombinase/integrase [Streptococcus pneumoniae]|uniref:Tyrosine-type recombinase/integrase n=1 Tax=Streptococcus pneumoniae TaxID=1313 RepID=A0A559CQP8_STREE|nr:tyrosine-type recombinase/integrase [Streptococcus pneumoniae]EPD20069.1 Integrase [Streptococcus pneumoniae MNZ14]ETE02040.1 isopentenyl pyrophosphate isomerase [Streptococcus pneumoniae 27]ETE25568.1 isopentenyl pyrophosphate isomerase [Streptococcus pneumoniae 1719]KGI35378.1 isopentenyl pyrophosphate isomerase [Streptococcus pneumoniae ECC_3510]OYL06849.1 isopentenyl pyrophosphate isomerase [Streptococcus pneumoniae B1598]OYL08363.1 isopentenyl pyrophosphate isomerase [Streptococcus pn
MDSQKSLVSYRVIGISDRVLEILKEYPLLEEGDYIFTNNGSSLMITCFNYFLKNSFRKSEIKKDDFVLTAHVFRYSHISLLAELEVPITAIMDCVDYTNETKILSVYTHVTEKMKSNITEKLDKLVLEND